MVLARINDLSLQFQSTKVFKHLSFDLEKGKQYALIGASGSGKTSLLRLLAGKIFQSSAVHVDPNVKIALVEQQHSFKNIYNTATFYYQQRFNSAGSEETITVEEYMNTEFNFFKEGKEDAQVQQLLHLLNVDKLLNRRLIQLSNGENKRVQLAKALLLEPQILLLDNAFIGLDQQARATLIELLKTIIKKDITLVLVTNENFIPDFITDVLQLDGQGSLQVVDKKNFLIADHQSTQKKLNTELLQELTADEEDEFFEYAIRMKNVQVKYGEKTILEGIDWTVRKGERWSLSGPNGAGKSTLLSLINADNPQAYANEIYLFDKRRGTGESIWDIKRRIGYVSPELHLYFESTASVFETVASGLFDTIGLFRVLNEEQTKRTLDWIKLLQLDTVKNKLLHQLPAGGQRLTLLARALIKNPPLLLLDEPVQGLDEEQASLFKTVVEEICAHSTKTLVYISHYKDEIPDCITKFIKLEEGRVV